MKKIILSVLAATVAISPMAVSAAEAQQYRDQRQRTTVVRERPNGTVVTRTVVRQNQSRGRAWRKGQRFDRRYAQNYREIDYRTYRGRGLYAPPRGHRWVRSGNDAVLIAIGSGLIGAVIGNAIR
ncbi:RcnB family protein [Sphingomonas sp.]|jgi:Ni/Co efflux regulator RcnB|uniref:RcnB family protein n=1 Tax=Sphingomonas sp. TaxID=28214 RepID=UPI002D7EBC61|nr:RcnB family protein [Sphingomonas sp.]HEU0044634.1 RcnB family protein [Sphingomonas sp.]